MVKDVMVHLDGTDADEFRLAAAENLGNVFEAHIIGLFLNTRPIVAVPIEDGYAATQTYLELEQRARKAGDQAEAILASKLARLGRPAEIRRSDLFADQIADVASREARSVDTFVALRPDSVGSSSTVEHEQAEAILGTGDADLVALARAHAAAHFGAQVKGPNQYLRSQPRQFPDLFRVVRADD